MSMRRQQTLGSMSISDRSVYYPSAIRVRSEDANSLVPH
jgi:hypothetical protein